LSILFNIKPAARALAKVNVDEQMLRLLWNCPIILAYYSAKMGTCHDCGPHHQFDSTRGITSLTRQEAGRSPTIWADNTLTCQIQTT